MRSKSKKSISSLESEESLESIRSDEGAKASRNRKSVPRLPIKSASIPTHHKSMIVKAKPVSEEISSSELEDDAPSNSRVLRCWKSIAQSPMKSVSAPTYHKSTRPKLKPVYKVISGSDSDDLSSDSESEDNAPTASRILHSHKSIAEVPTKRATMTCRMKAGSNLTENAIRFNFKTQWQEVLNVEEPAIAPIEKRVKIEEELQVIPNAIASGSQSLPNEDATALLNDLKMKVQVLVSQVNVLHSTLDLICLSTYPITLMDYQVESTSKQVDRMNTCMLAQDQEIKSLRKIVESRSE
ncbi:hypothetical protein C8Q75DRAFT_812200 [Abortiporus biennis]|nr:hypothetical protein C8Q75DRAFT_812200 [Abortiporus biennis]